MREECRGENVPDYTLIWGDELRENIRESMSLEGDY